MDFQRTAGYCNNSNNDIVSSDTYSDMKKCRKFQQKEYIQCVIQC